MRITFHTGYAISSTLICDYAGRLLECSPKREAPEDCVEAFQFTTTSSKWKNAYG